MKKIKFLIIFILYVFYLKVTCQHGLDLQITIVKDYEPNIIQSEKISFIPEIIDTYYVPLKFEYNLQPKKVESIYQPQKLKPAKFVAEQLPKLLSNELILGGGLPGTILGSYSINTQRSSKFNAGAKIDHFSTRGNVKVNDKKISANYTNNEFDAYLKFFLKDYSIFGKFNYNNLSYKFYGYNNLHKTLPILHQQNVNLFDLKAGIYSNNVINSDKLNYNCELNYAFYYDKFKNLENNVFFKTKLSKFFKEQVIGGDIILDWYNTNTWLDTNSRVVFSLYPWFLYYEDTWRVNFGLAFEIEGYSDSTFLHLYPRANIQYNIIKNYLIPFIGFEGKLISNSLIKNIYFNPYLLPEGVHFRTTNQLLSIYGGFKGNFTKELNYFIRTNYSIFEYLPFYVSIDTFFIHDDLFTSFLQNYFFPVYDGNKIEGCQELNLKFELEYQKKEKFNIVFRFDYYKYLLSNLNRPYNKPIFDASLLFRYNIFDKFYITLSSILIGKRYDVLATYNKTKDKLKINTATEKELKPFVDLGFRLDYKYSKILYFFLNFNNILNKKYAYWNNYYTYGLQFFLGVSANF